MTDSKKVTLSVSSMKTLNSCPQKYFYKKVSGTPVDPDHEESDALSFGKAFHKVLEDTLHTNYSDKLILEAMKEFEVSPFSRPLLTAMLDNYVKLHRASGLKVVKCEFEIHIADLYRGFVDFIAVDNGGWWIGDNKTAARFDPSITGKLHKDPQVAIYTKFAPFIAEALGLKGIFRGFRYRQSIKSKAATPAGLAKGTPTYDFVIPAAAIDPEAAWSVFLEAHQAAVELSNGGAPRRNYGACMEYFRPCEFFSQCHGNLHSEGNPLITVHTVESLNDSDLLG